MIKLSILLSKAVSPKQNDFPDPYFLPDERNKEVMYDFVPFGWSDKHNGIVISLLNGHCHLLSLPWQQPGGALLYSLRGSVRHHYSSCSVRS